MPLPTVVENNSFLDIIRAVTDRDNINPDVIHKLIDAQERILDRQAEMDFNIAMGHLRKQLNEHPIIKNKDNPQTKSKYSDLNAIKKVLDPLMADFGFYDRYEDSFPVQGMIMTTCEIVHTSGHAKRNSVMLALDDVGIAGSKNKTAPHAGSSTMTYNQRLALGRAFGIRIGDDKDGNSIKTVSQEDIQEIRSGIEMTESNEADFLKYMNVPKLSDILSRDMPRIRMSFKSKMKKKAEV